MKQINLIILMLTFSITFSFAQELQYNKTFGGAAVDDARGMVATDDGNFVFTGIDKSTRDIAGDSYIAKMSPSGDIIWKKYFEFAGPDYGNDIIKTMEGGFLVVGDVVNETLGTADGFVIKTDVNGEVEWQKFVLGNGNDSFKAVVQDQGGNFFITGKRLTTNSEIVNTLFCEISEFGELEFINTISSQLETHGNKIVSTGYGQFVICGHVYHSDTNNEEMMVIGVNSDGQANWTCRMATTDHEQAKAMIVNEQGNILIAGGHSREEDGSDYLEMRMYSFTNDGQLFDTKPILAEQGEGYIYDILETPDGYMVAGVFRDFDADTGNATVIKVDEHFGVREIKETKTDYESVATNLLLTADGDIYTSGVAYYGENSSDALVSKWAFDSFIDVTESEVESNMIKSVLYPNPFTTHTVLSIDTEVEEKLLRIFDIEGKLKREETFSGKSFILKRGSKRDLPSGIYLYHVTDQNGEVLSTGKMQVIDQA